MRSPNWDQQEGNKSECLNRNEIPMMLLEINSGLSALLPDNMIDKLEKKGQPARMKMGKHTLLADIWPT